VGNESLKVCLPSEGVLLGSDYTVIGRMDLKGARN